MLRNTVQRLHLTRVAKLEHHNELGLNHARTRSHLMITTLEFARSRHSKT